MFLLPTKTLHILMQLAGDNTVTYLRPLLYTSVV